MQVSCEISRDFPWRISSRGPTAAAIPRRGCCRRAAPSDTMKSPHATMTESQRGECRPPLNKPTCWARWGALTALRVVFRLPATQLPRVCWASYRGHRSWNHSMSMPHAMDHSPMNGNVHHWPSHMTTIICDAQLIKYCFFLFQGISL